MCVGRDDGMGRIKTVDRNRKPPNHKRKPKSHMPGLLSIIRGGGKFTHKDHWVAFQPHCPQITGVPCPPECKHHGEARFDGCHVCDCLHSGDKG